MKLWMFYFVTVKYVRQEKHTRNDTNTNDWFAVVLCVSNKIFILVFRVNCFLF